MLRVQGRALLQLLVLLLPLLLVLLLSTPACWCSWVGLMCLLMKAFKAE
jgi:hypothetical protein